VTASPDRFSVKVAADKAVFRNHLLAMGETAIRFATAGRSAAR